MDAAAGLNVFLPGPIDLPATLRTVGRWGDDGIDRWDGDRLLRTVSLRDGEVLGYAARVGASVERPELEVWFERALDESEAEDASRRIAATIVPQPAQAEALGRLARSDAAIGELVARYPGLAAVQFPDPLAALVRSISAQQVNLRWAARIRRRLAARYGRRHAVADSWVSSLPAGPLADASIDELRELQLTTAKAAALIACAREAVAGRLERSELEGLDDEALIARLVGLRGIGRWSAEWFLSRTLGRPRVVAGDLGVRKAVGRLYAGGGVPPEDAVRTLTAHWGAAASLAQALALYDLAERPDLPGPRLSRSAATPPRPRSG